ncbi:hypothetical protein K9U40_10145 [Xanthobacter autotrophicus]|uniref:hypothetical protein n=1 Tax=Xanthobacter TaxID=279 RepID=UPI0024AA8D12|nr:hypothetical protein [Xanthobacter autotrophicus]MDI4664685.1 hypothetical protein [Xanthobacter autotrophicus]
MHLSQELTLIAQWYERHLSGDIVITAPAAYVLAGQFRDYAARAAELEELARTLTQMEAVAQDFDALAQLGGTAPRRAVVPSAAMGADNVVAFPAAPRSGGAA